MLIQNKISAFCDQRHIPFKQGQILLAKFLFVSFDPNEPIALRKALYTRSTY